MSGLLLRSCLACGDFIHEDHARGTTLLTRDGQEVPWLGEAPEGYAEVPMCDDCAAAFQAWCQANPDDAEDAQP